MKRLRPAFVTLIFAGSVAAASAGEPPLLKSMSDAASSTEKSTAAAATDAAKAAADTKSPPAKKGKSTAKSNGSAKDQGTVAAQGNASKGKGAAESKKASAPQAAEQPTSNDATAKAAGSTSPVQAGKSCAQAPPPTSTAARKGQPADQKPAPEVQRGASTPEEPCKEASGAAAPAEAKKSAPVVPKEWPALDIELAKARCTQLLKGLDAVTLPEAPFREGDCGAPAPVRLVSVGKSPEVAFSPPALVTCDMVVALHRWITGDLQPLARKHLGADVSKVEVMSDYACRMAYGRVGNKLSEHGRANALDIRGFVTTKAKTAYVLEEWGQTKRDITAKIAAAKAAAEKAESERIAAEQKAAGKPRDPNAASADEKPSPPPAAMGTNGAPPVAGLAKTTIIDGVPRLTITLPGGGPAKSATAADAQEGAGLAPRHLGGPKVATESADAKSTNKTKSLKNGPAPSSQAAAPAPSAAAAPVSDEPPTKTSRFLHEAHDAACRIFGTTLGPEANDAHRNHFHVDMAERKHDKICD